MVQIGLRPKCGIVGFSWASEPGTRIIRPVFEFTPKKWSSRGVSMRTVECLEEYLRVAEQRGYEIRQEWLDGNGGGVCEFGGKKWLFVDLALSTVEQLAQVSEALAADADLTSRVISKGIHTEIRTRHVA